MVPMSDRTEKEDDLEEHRQTPWDRTGFCALVRNVRSCLQNG
jgi:hypothetical protein